MQVKKAVVSSMPIPQPFQDPEQSGHTFGNGKPSGISKSTTSQVSSWRLSVAYARPSPLALLGVALLAFLAIPNTACARPARPWLSQSVWLAPTLWRAPDRPIARVPRPWGLSGAHSSIPRLLERRRTCADSCRLVLGTFSCLLRC